MLLHSENRGYETDEAYYYCKAGNNRLEISLDRR